MERTVFYFENENESCLYNAQVLRLVRQLFSDTFVVMVSAGQFTSGGSMLTPARMERSEEYMKSGADLILSLPVTSILGGYGQKEIAGAALVQRLRVPERIVVPCIPAEGQTLQDCEDCLRSCAMLMLREPPGYRSGLQGYLEQNMPFREAQMRAVCDVMPEATAVLSHSVNCAALWVLFALLQLYYMAEVEFIHAPQMHPGGPCDVGTGLFHEKCRTWCFEDASERYMKGKIREILTSGTQEQLIDISGSTPQMVSVLIQEKDTIWSLDSMEQIAQLLLPESLERIHLFLLKMILGIRKIYMQICSLHVYVPYCHVWAENPEKHTQIRQLAEKSWVSFAGKNYPEQKKREEYHYLLDIDERAEELVIGITV